MKGDMVEKKKLDVSGENLEGLIGVEEYPMEEGTASIAGVDKIVQVKNGVTTIPSIPMTFKITRNSKTLKFLYDWKNKNEYHDCTMIRTDGAGVEFARELMPNVECSRYVGPAYDASNPAPATVSVTLLPEDIIPIDAE